MKNPLIHRRTLIQTAGAAGLGMALPWRMARRVWAQAPGAAIPGFPDDRVLVILKLDGGNDGLNTIVPYADDAYGKARGECRLSEDLILKHDDYLGFHKGLTGLKALLDDGKLAVINGVGYPQPNHSHFRSTEIWHTATDSDRYGKTGWLAGYLNQNAGPAAETVCSVCIDKVMPELYNESNGYGVGFVTPSFFRWLHVDGSGTPERFAALNHAAASDSQVAEPALDHLRQTTERIVKASAQVQAATAGMPDEFQRKDGLGFSLQVVQRLIEKGLPSRVYYVSMGGFDTHAGQMNAHNGLMEQLGSAVAGFMKGLKQSGASSRVLLMCFSEFGRRVEENASRGTDHGTAGPMFMAGDAVKAGLYGDYPSLTDLDDGDLKHTVDYRQVYTTVLERWLKADAQKLLGRKFTPVECL